MERIDFDTAPLGDLPDTTKWLFRVPKTGLWTYTNLSLRIPDDGKHHIGDRVMLTYNGTTYETMIDSITPADSGFVKVAVHFLLNP